MLEQRILEALKQRQERLGLSDSEFAKLLGVPRRTWGLTRDGTKPVRHKIAQAARRAFPELEPLCALFLLSYGTGVPPNESADILAIA